ncbi:PI-PLC domain-containing protein [Chitinophaga japonensis]|uniref:1-phosphatidylinositol phosphodiesterase n=1 Tax=Chitinophaga japonensis TaxID=104662 RepID=A0A562SRW8_CHIJA|nr:hypothetical protein [Chitinophaga japonensis]TWI83995.1 hypothetical protein LX66_4356 [Chitinophaga japonensis]
MSYSSYILHLSSFFLLLTAGLRAQNLSFTPPVSFLPHAVTDKAIDITRFGDGYFVAWKAAGSSGGIYASFLGRHQDTAFSRQEVQVPGAGSSMAPVLQVLGQRLYLLWPAGNGALQYVMNDTDTSLDISHVYTVKLSGPQPAYGITTTAVGKRIFLAAHGSDRSSLVYALLEPGPDGLLADAAMQVIPGKKAAEYPFVTRLTDTDVRICWRGYKEQQVYYADCHLPAGTWTDALPLDGASAGAAPALYHVWDTRRLFYIWKGPERDARLYYTTAATGQAAGTVKVLPAYFTAAFPVAVCEVDANNFIMAYPDAAGRLYLSYFAAYNPATWMQDLFFPERADHTLKDIVIPGSHDAGMSVLSGTGGQMKEAINACNTLTQQIPIRTQLREGLRMFDLRVGRYNGALYTKHAESDCDTDAVGAGYGEKLDDVLGGVRSFLDSSRMETVILTFSHFCDADVPTSELADTIIATLGPHLYRRSGQKLSDLPLKDLAGKAIVVFEQRAYRNGAIDSSTMTDASGAFINIRRKYAATNDINKLLAAQAGFFNSMQDGVRDNDLVRLDWQLTQSSQEAALVCNGLRPDRTGALVSGVILLTNALKKNQTILDLSAKGNRYLLPTLDEWIANGTVNARNKPNILYVDVAGGWITDYCIDLNNSPLYRK